MIEKHATKQLQHIQTETHGSCQRNHTHNEPKYIPKLCSKQDYYSSDSSNDHSDDKYE